MLRWLLFTALAAVLLLLLISGAASRSSYARTVSYEGQKVYRCQFNDTRIVGRLAASEDLDVWKVSPEGLADIRTMNEAGERELRRLGCFVHIRDVDEWLAPHEDSLKQDSSSASLNSSLDYFDEYHTYESILGFYTALAAQYSELVTFTPSIGQSLELRPMPAVKITAATGEQTPVVLLTCQIHAREWISSSTCMFMAQTLLERVETDPRVREILTHSELHIIPFMNPDGYVYTWTGDRLWRKNRRVNTGSNCRGVDLNRNFNIRWAEPGGGSSGNPCSETYHGTSAESEPEIEHLVNYFRQHAPIIGGIDYHSYGQLILRPWGFTRDPPPHEEQLKAVGDGMENVMRSVHGETYVSEPGMDLYPTVGTSSDWFYSEDAGESK